MLNEQDVAPVLSVNGEADEVVFMMQVAKSNGCKIIAITGSHCSMITELADVILPFYYEEEQVLLSAAIPQISQLAIFDVVFHQLLFLNKQVSLSKQNKDLSLSDQVLASQKLATL